MSVEDFDRKWSARGQAASIFWEMQELQWRALVEEATGEPPSEHAFRIYQSRWN